MLSSQAGKKGGSGEYSICIYIYIHICTDACMHAYMHGCMHTCMHAYIHACIHSYPCMHAYICTCMHACIHMYIYIHIYTYTHIYIWLWDVMGCYGCTLVHVRSYSMHCIFGMMVPFWVVPNMWKSQMVGPWFLDVSGGVSYYGEGICSITC